jgi:hypothetical protein
MAGANKTQSSKIEIFGFLHHPQFFALRQILEKGNEYNIPTHHLFIDFKAAYDTIIRNEVYVSM